LVQCVQKIFVFRPKGGHRPVPPPLNTPLAMITVHTKFVSSYAPLILDTSSWLVRVEFNAPLDTI